MFKIAGLEMSLESVFGLTCTIDLKTDAE